MRLEAIRSVGRTRTMVVAPTRRMRLALFAMLLGATSSRALGGHRTHPARFLSLNGEWRFALSMDADRLPAGFDAARWVRIFARSKRRVVGTGGMRDFFAHAGCGGLAS